MAPRPPASRRGSALCSSQRRSYWISTLACLSERARLFPRLSNRCGATVFKIVYGSPPACARAPPFRKPTRHDSSHGSQTYLVRPTLRVILMVPRPPALAPRLGPLFPTPQLLDLYSPVSERARLVPRLSNRCGATCGATVLKYFVWYPAPALAPPHLSESRPGTTLSHGS